ncbi:MAG: glycosyl hydrolase family 28 protein [Bacteroidales bacterium]
MQKITVFIFFSLLVSALPAQKFVIYPAPEGAEAAPEFELEVNGQPVFVYNTRSAALAYFSFEGKVDIKVTFLSPVNSFDIRPKSRNIRAEGYRNQIRFSLENPENLSLEINKNIKRPLFIFANPPEKDIPAKNDPDVLFFEGGKIHSPGEVLLKSGQTVYIEGGAIVRGHFIADQCRNVKICGRGILDNSLYARGEYRPVEINRCDQLLIDGIIITESRHWSCAAFASTNVSYNNFKIVSSNDWDDGIDIVGSQHVHINNCFIQTKDDCIAIKSGVNYYTKFNSSIRVDDVLIENSVFWNGVWGNGLEIGFETRTDTIQNIIFRNCDIIHVEGPEGTFTIHNGDRALVRNVLYENIRVEDSQGWLIDFRILQSQYSKDKQRGKIENVVLRNIQVEGDNFPYSQLIGFSRDNAIRGVVLEDVFIQGIKINSIYNGRIATANCEELIFR